MLASLRSGSQHIIVKLLLILLAGSFMLWGVADIITRPSANNAATIGSVGVPMQQYQDALSQEVQRYQQMLGTTLSQEDIRAYGLPQAVVGRLIREELLNQHLDTLNLRLGSDVVLNEINSNPLFFNEEGVFDRNSFASLLRANQMTEDDFFTMVTRSKAQELLLSSVEKAPATSDIIAEPLYLYRNQKRDISALVVSSSIITTLPTPTQEELEAYYRTKSDLFTIPEHRTIDYVTFDVTKATSGLNVTDEDIKRTYESRKDEFTSSISRNVEQYVFQTDEAAQAALAYLEDALDAISLESEADITSVTDVSAKALKESGLSYDYADLGWVTEDGLLNDMKEPVFTAEKGAFTSPIQTPLGWHVLFIKGEESGVTKPLSEVKSTLRAQLQADLYSDALRDLMNRLEDDLASGASLKQLANTHSLELYTLTDITREGHDISGTKIATMPHSEAILASSFNGDEGFPSDISLLPDNQTYLITLVNNIKPLSIRPFSDVSQQVIALWKKNKQSELLALKAAEISKKLEDKTLSWSQALAMKHISSFTQKNLKRPHPQAQKYDDERLPLRAVLAAFTLQENDTTPAFVNEQGSYVIARPTAVIPAQLSKKSTSYRALTEELKGSIAQSLAQSYLGYLHDRYNVQVNRSIYATEEN